LPISRRQQWWTVTWRGQFAANDRYTIADIMALVTVNFATRINLTVPEACSHLRRWHETVSARPSAAA
jgi:glutathione S-transferase